MEDGEPFTDEATVTFSLDESASGNCSVDSETKNLYGCGRDRAGTYEIVAIVPGHEEVSETVVVEMDGCRLAGQALELEIGEECEEKDVVSVHVLVVKASDSSPIDDAVVKFKPVTEAGGMQNCDPGVESNGHDCAVNVAGDIRISVLKAGFTGTEQVVTVQMGTCYVETEELVVEMDEN